MATNNNNNNVSVNIYHLDNTLIGTYDSFAIASKRLLLNSGRKINACQCVNKKKKNGKPRGIYCKTLGKMVYAIHTPKPIEINKPHHITPNTKTPSINTQTSNAQTKHNHTRKTSQEQNK